MTQTLRWLPEGALHKKIRKQLGEETSIDQEIGDETPEEILDELRLLFSKYFGDALSSKPQVRVLLGGNDEKQTKPISAIVRWLRGEHRNKLTEYDEVNTSLPLYLDFVAEPGESLCFQGSLVLSKARAFSGSRQTYNCIQISHRSWASHE